VVGDPLYEVNFRNSSLWDQHDWTYTTTFSGAATNLKFVRDREKKNPSYTNHAPAFDTARTQIRRYNAARV
jgi:hypothetical protein